MDAYVKLVLDVLTRPHHLEWIAPCLMAGEAVLGCLIIWRIPYTEIDWTTYMQQVRLFLDGERDYTLIKGDTGPLVYPAVHVYIYTALYHLTNRGVDVVFAQGIFHILYLVTLAFVLACYRRIDAPPWLLAPLVLSKRLHSIFVLRLFNDAWAALGLWVSIYAFQRRAWVSGAVTWCLGLGVKMTLLLAAPAVGAILVQGAGTSEGLLIGVGLLQLQLAAAFPFVTESKSREYISRAFDLSRQFLFKWTVNWRFLGEDVFLARKFGYSLLLAHVCLLLSFFQTRWVRLSSSGIIDFVRRNTSAATVSFKEKVSERVTPLFVMDAMLGSMAIGFLCARSLHYQFYAYIAWATPYLLWRSGLGPIWVYTNYAMQEIAWLTYPSTNLSSFVVVLQLFLSIASLWWGSGRRKVSSEARQESFSKRNVE